MRLLYVCSDFGIPPGGTKGASVHLRAITSALGDLEHDVRLLSPLADHASGLSVPALTPAGLTPVHDSAKRLRTWLEEHGHDAAVAKELRALSYGALAAKAALRALGAWRPDAVIERLSLLSQLGLDIARACAVPLVVEVNALLTEEAAAYRALELRGLAAAMESRMLEQADAVVAVSAPLAALIARRCPGHAMIHVIPNGVDVARFDLSQSRAACRSELGFATDDVVIGFCGSLKPWHGVDLLVEAFERLSRHVGRARLLIVGTGPGAAGLQALIRQRVLSDRVTLTGAVPHDQAIRHLRAMDVAVAPFRAVDDFYFSPIKLFEYMAAGACVVASRLGQMAEVIEHGRNGLLCPPDDAQALCDVLREACDDARSRQRMAAAAARDVRQRYTWKRAAQSVDHVIRSVRRDQRRPRPVPGQQAHSTAPEVRPPSLVACGLSLSSRRSSFIQRKGVSS